MTIPGGVGYWWPVVVVSVAALPLGALAVALRVRRARAHGVPREESLRRAVGEVGAVAGTLPWLWMILTPLPEEPEVRLVPLRDLAAQLGGDPATAFFQIVGNLLVFAAFGLCAPLRWRLSPWAVTGLAALGSATVECGQYVLALGRVSSVDDVLLNAAGAGLAALLGRRYVRYADAGSPIRPV